MPSKDALSILFGPRLPRMNRASFLKFCDQKGLDGSDVVARRCWTDERGKSWSLMGRLGYLQFISSKPPRSTMLMDHFVQLSLARDGFPAKVSEDMLWAWLGCSNAPASSSTRAALQSLFSQIRPVSPAVPSSGFGLPDDGGWLSSALDLVESLVQSHGTPPRGARWACRLLMSNLLDATPVGSMSAWDFGVQTTGGCLPEGARLPSLAPGSVRGSPRPAALEGVYDEVLARHLELIALMVRHSPSPTQTLDLDLGFTSKGDASRFLDFVGPKSLESFAGLLDALCNSPPSSPAWGMIIPVMNVLTSLHHRAPVSKGLWDRAFHELQKPANTQPGEPPGTIVDWTGNVVSPQLVKWMAAHGLDNALPQHLGESHRPRSRARL